MKKLTLCLLVSCFFLAGCATQQVTFSDEPVDMQRKAEFDKWQNFFVFGLAPPHKSVNVNKICPNGPALIQTEQTFINGLVSGITYNLFYPRSMKIYCKT